MLPLEYTHIHISSPTIIKTITIITTTTSISPSPFPSSLGGRYDGPQLIQGTTHKYMCNTVTNPESVVLLV